jgi:hypothetical protein
MAVKKPHIGKAESHVKRELDRLELVERVPALRREAARTGRGLDERGYPLSLLILPNHPAVIAYVRECASLKYEPCTTKNAARRNLTAARINYKDRVIYRTRRDIAITPDEELGCYTDFARFISLSAIIEARAEAKHWRKVIVKLETAEKMKQQKRWNDARSHVTPI